MAKKPVINKSKTKSKSKTKTRTKSKSKNIKQVKRLSIIKTRLLPFITDSINLIIIGQILTGIGLITFWILFFSVGMIDKNAAPDCYFTYEHAFPPADIILAFALLISSGLMIKRIPFGKSISLVCAGALIFLGLLDFSFNLQNKIYFISISEAVSNGFINAWCVFFGSAIFMKFKI
jgi:hypothetical protein